MSHEQSRQVLLARRPEGWPEHDDFEPVTRDLPELGEGEVRVANEFVSVDPYMRGKMDDRESYTPPYALGEPLTGAAVGRVVASRHPELSEGTLVLHQQGWRDAAQGRGEEFRAVPEVPDVPTSAYLGVLGGTGLTAYVGLLDIARMQPGETVFVSAAAGAVGSVVGQIARVKGAGRVVGSAGSPEKVRTLTERYGFDAGFDHHDGPAADRLAEVAPDGVDVYFDNVGGEQLEAAIGALNRYGRVACCGAISAYNATEPPLGPRNLGRVVTHSLTLRGFIVSDHLDRQPDFLEEMGPWLREGRVRAEETVVDGVEHLVDAFLVLLRGANTGKMVVRVG
ncbi:NADP-dependent oxidoreductase [Desertihabitans brevis]|uniref:NADP-dependent oxidoreductase n=1 Tax=Desertihabitans brevis TaxID=2268447 RepID=A0A367YQA8_9ACTN|nr:NADP-dependent oxidoreductase [Desertihabitans brevis]RCK67917.1 NADP-dependent oxidoreductase [Desertihabitans brevis]